MHTEQEWGERIDVDDEHGAAERYRYFMKTEPHETLGPMYEVDDPWLGKGALARDMRIGMVRNAADENRREVQVFLKPFPHTRLEKAKDLQGWYQSKVNESKQSRPRPCFTEAILTEPFGGFCAVGCAFSLPGGELVDTPDGLRTIESFRVGDVVYGRGLLGMVETKVLGATRHWKPEGYLILCLSDGRQLRMTADHPIYSVSRRGWFASETFIRYEEVEDRARPTLNPHVVGIESVEGGVEVFDIETGTGNFYQQGILVHNCYINSGMRGYRGSGLITVPLHYGEQIKKQLSKMRRAAAGYFSSFTDPFTPLENYYHNTEDAAREFVKVGLPIFFLSRLAYPAWAIDLLTKNPHSYAQKSINTPDPTDWKYLSPGAISLDEHLKEITELKRRGIYVSIQVNPIVPGVTSNEQIVTLFRMLRDAGADHVIVKFVEAAYSWAPAMVEKMVKRFGDRGRVFESLFTQNIGAERTIDEAYRLRAHRLFSAAARRLGLTYATCYEYEYERDEDGKILSKVGKSIGRKFATSSQCHGHTVPVYARTSEDEPFRPLDECPPSGCLYCAEENTAAPGKARCGDELAGSAVALKLSDLKVPIGQGKRRGYELPMI